MVTVVTVESVAVAEAVGARKHLLLEILLAQPAFWLG